MSAKEMFERLGYTKEDVVNSITGEIYEFDYQYEKYDGSWLNEILFNDSTKLVHINSELFDKTQSPILYFELLQAINTN